MPFRQTMTQPFRIDKIKVAIIFNMTFVSSSRGLNANPDFRSNRGMTADAMKTFELEVRGPPANQAYLHVLTNISFASKNP
jgi:hypothetical protein